jgi:hypothetical protein
MENTLRPVLLNFEIGNSKPVLVARISPHGCLCDCLPGSDARPETLDILNSQVAKHEVRALDVKAPALHCRRRDPPAENFKYKYYKGEKKSSASHLAEKPTILIISPMKNATTKETKPYPWRATTLIERNLPVC